MDRLGRVYRFQEFYLNFRTDRYIAWIVVAAMVHRLSNRQDPYWKQKFIGNFLDYCIVNPTYTNRMPFRPVYLHVYF